MYYINTLVMQEKIPNSKEKLVFHIHCYFMHSCTHICMTMCQRYLNYQVQSSPRHSDSLNVAHYTGLQRCVLWDLHADGVLCDASPATHSPATRHSSSQGKRDAGLPGRWYHDAQTRHSQPPQKTNLC